METSTLNLTRKWRSTQFQEVVGQELVVRILQNSLFKNSFFPVYLFSGQRGCGKTSTARVFATALNCQKLSAFQKDAKIIIPCLQCSSCQAMARMQHPDFIEIDAASYTGVDNIRNIIDTSSFLPLLGTRKIYLIDEVHMLSKAAFNAFLKILEEPAPFVTFILATTEIQKLPDTIRSRCFQLFFNPVELSSVVRHLQNICQKESIVHHVEALEIVAQVSQGSLRDAINLLEQARFASATVTKTSVLAVLGYPQDVELLAMMQAIVNKEQKKLMDIFASWSQQVVAIDYVIKRSIEILYDVLLLKYQAPIKYMVTMHEELQQLATVSTLSDVTVCFDELCNIDLILNKTSKKQLLFESLMIRLSLREHIQQEIHQHTSHLGHTQDEKKKLNEPNVDDYVTQWQKFVQLVAAHVDPVLASMLYATELTSFNPVEKIVRVSTLKKFVLFQDLFIEQKQQYQEFLDKIFGFSTMLVVEFVLTEQKNVQAAAVSKQNITVKKIEMVKQAVPEKNEAKIVKPAAFADTSKWKITNILLDYFGGNVREITKDNHEFNA